MPALNEKEIQEKLYGKYSKGTMPAVENQEQISLHPTVKKPEEEKVIHIDLSKTWESTSRVLAGASQVSIKILQQVPWRFVGVLAGAVITAIVFIQLISFTLDKVSDMFSGNAKGKKQTVSESKRVTKAKDLMVQAPVKHENKKTMVERHTESKPDKAAVASGLAISGREAGGATAVVTAPEAVETNLPVAADTAVAKKQKFYAVQICTYQKEADAQKLAEELSALSFKPFFRKVDMLQQESFYYEVYLGRTEDYAAAKTQLDDFKKTELFQKFSDSFIRSL